jgi:hypothetical protein
MLLKYLCNFVGARLWPVGPTSLAGQPLAGAQEVRLALILEVRLIHSNQAVGTALRVAVIGDHVLRDGEALNRARRSRPSSRKMNAGAAA